MTTAAPDLSSISRESGGLAMLAVDQREALRAMLQTARGEAFVTDQQMVDFKVEAARQLTPYASAVLVDHQFGLDAVVDRGALDPGCGLIASADEFHPGNGLPVDRVTIDEASTPAHAVEVGAKAMKLLVLWRSDESAEERRALVDDFVARCHEKNLLAIIEPVVRHPRASAEFDKESAILKAAEELGDTAADLYKGEMPRGGRGTDSELYTACRELDARISTPWVILSSGVDPDLFPNAVRQAVAAGAQGFLAGRAVWSCTLGFPDPSAALRDLAVPRLKRLGEIVDEALANR
jgi:sulfofructosephosphate aldolase